LIKSLLLIARNGVTLKFIPNFREIVTGIIQTASVIAGMRIVAAAIVEAVLGFAIYILAAVRAIIGVMIDDIVDQACIKNLRKNGAQPSFIGVKSESHRVFPKNFSVGDALHVIRVERIGLASQVVIISPRIKSINDISLEEVKISLVFIIPSAVKAEILGKAGERHVRLCRGERWGRRFGGRGRCCWERRLAG